MRDFTVEYIIDNSKIKIPKKEKLFNEISNYLSVEQNIFCYVYLKVIGTIFNRTSKKLMVTAVKGEINFDSMK